MTEFAVVGGGWRAAYYVHVANSLPGLFRVSGVMIRNPEKQAAFAQKYRVRVVGTLDELLATPCDFVLNAGGRMEMDKIVLQLLERGVPLLSETPPGADTPALVRVWERHRELDVPFQVAEQCFARPYQRAVQAVVDKGLLGRPVDVTLSMFHDYHAASVIRMNLGVGMEPCRVTGHGLRETLLETAGRGGLVAGGGPVENERQVVVLQFESGKTALIDFMMDQYFSQIRSCFTRVRGQRGEVFGDEVRYVAGTGEFICEQMRRVELGRGANLEGFSLRGITLGGAYLFRNPFGEASSTDYRRLSDDEIAVADCLAGMKRYIETGEEFYPLAAAFQDAYLANVINEAVEKNTTMETQNMPWAGR